MIQSADSGIDLTIVFHFVVVGIFHRIPRRLERVSLSLTLLLVELRSSKFAVVYEKAIGGLKLKTFHCNTHRVFSDIGSCKFHEYLRILDDFAHTFFSSAHPTIEIRLRIVKPHVGALFKLLACAHLCEFHLSITHRCCEFLRSLRHIDAQFRLLHLDKFGELSHGAVDVEREHLFLHRRFEFGKGSFAFEIGLCLAVIVIESRLCATFRINLKDAEVFLDFRWCVVRICHGDDGISFHQDGEFPERSIEVVDDASASIDVTREIVHPISFGKIDAIAAVVALFVSCRVLVNGCHEEGVTIHELILCALT